MSDLDLTAVEVTVLEHFHGPDDRHASWWINTEEMARAVYPVIAAQVREQIAQGIAQRASEHRAQCEYEGCDLAACSDFITGLNAAERIARRGAR